MKKVLGLDLGVGSIGWALVEKDENNEPVRILKIGSRTVPLLEGEEDTFSKGAGIPTNKERTLKRTARKCNNRYKLRREQLTDGLRAYDMLPDETLVKLNPLKLWELRAKAVTEKVSLRELGRILYHLNQKRGYKHSKDNEQDSKQTEYVAAVNKRYAELQNKGLTIGQYFAKKLKESEHIQKNGTSYSFRIKDKVYPRAAYEEECRKILATQQTFYPKVLTDEVVDDFFNFIYYQRPLKSCKHLVGRCELEKQLLVSLEKDVRQAPRVAPLSSPLAQLDKIWESVNNFTVKNKRNENLDITLEQRKSLVEYLQCNMKIKVAKVREILGITNARDWLVKADSIQALQGNKTRIAIAEALASGSLSKEEIEGYLKFDMPIGGEEYVDIETGELSMRAVVNRDFEKQPLQRLWHFIYSIHEEQDLRIKLQSFGIKDEAVLDALCGISFKTSGYANKSTKAIRKILPYLMEGDKYSEACMKAGYNHSNSITSEQEAARPLKKQLPQIQKNEMRQPVVEKILNQMINIVNTLLKKYPLEDDDEIRVELARKLKQSKDEREEANRDINANRRRNEEIKKRISNEYGLTPTRNRIMKYRMWEETDGRCIYCGKGIGLSEFLNAVDADREHIIPKALLFDDSFSNQTCSCSKCNGDKKERTALDYMRDCGKEAEFIERVNDLYEAKKISHTKYNHLLASFRDYIERKKQGKETEDDKKLWEDFIDRQLRQSQMIARKSIEILRQICHNVYATSGSVTDFLRHQWGYDTILHDLNFARYASAGVERQVERIKEWNKRLDNRHHAVDALTIALTTQSMIQRINTLWASKDDMHKEVEDSHVKFNEKKTLLEKWIAIQPHIAYSEAKAAVSEILISQRSGKHITTPGKRYEFKGGRRILRQRGLVVPRTSLHDEFVYGQISRYNSDGKFQKEIVRKYGILGGMGCLFNGKETYSVTQTIDRKTGMPSIKVKDGIKDVLDKIVDGGVRKRILERLNRGFEPGKDYRSDVKKALDNLRNLEEDPIYLDDAKTIPIKTVRKFTRSTKALPLRYNEKHEPIAFVEPGGNHHVALYKAPDGSIKEHLCTNWHAVQRRLYGLPAIIENPMEVWTQVVDRDNLPEDLLTHLPEDKYEFVMSMQIGDAFILGMEEEEYLSALREKNYALLGEYLYFVQNLSASVYRFRRHTESQFDITQLNKKDKRFYNIQSLSSLYNLNPHKVKITILGEIFND
ncbi:MAG: type II CRISPR RNA-guided endonuclease Cas9 [Alloprevotella sp.]|nr:type II CRISPR RNA-guided endonuclease Cas9 [Prevotella sp.]MBR1712894.1 type II CRISPR RNA-guided endonuclease Cas9 [Alloprevotella sp.]